MLERGVLGGSRAAAAGAGDHAGLEQCALWQHALRQRAPILTQRSAFRSGLLHTMGGSTGLGSMKCAGHHAGFELRTLRQRAHRQRIPVLARRIEPLHCIWNHRWRKLPVLQQGQGIIDLSQRFQVSLL